MIYSNSTVTVKFGRDRKWKFALCERQKNVSQVYGDVKAVSAERLLS